VLAADIATFVGLLSAVGLQFDLVDQLLLFFAGGPRRSLNQPFSPNGHAARSPSLSHPMNTPLAHPSKAAIETRLSRGKLPPDATCPFGLGSGGLMIDPFAHFTNAFCEARGRRPTPGRLDQS